VYLKVFEKAVEIIYRTDYYDESNLDMEPSPKFQVQISSDENPQMIRDMQSNLVGKLVCVPGIITSTSKTMIKARKAVFTCNNCGHMKQMDIPFGFAKVSPPAFCDNSRNPGSEKQNCKMNSYQVNTDKSEFYDHQTIKLQEAPEMIPTGEMPRTVLLTTDRYLTDKCTPGNRVKIMGVLSVFNPKKGEGSGKGDKRVSYIRVLGIQSIVN